MGLTKEQRPKVKLVGQNGNIYNLIGVASKELRKAGFITESKEMTDKIFQCSSYDEALSTICEYVNPY
jgi:hypothetical protein